MTQPGKSPVLAILGKKLALEHANNYRKTGAKHSELRQLAQQILSLTDFLRPASKRVFLYLGKNGPRFNPTWKEIQRVTGLSERAVALSMRELESAGLIRREIFRRPAGDRKTERGTKIHTNHISAWRLGDALDISAKVFPKVDVCVYVADEHREFALAAPCDFLHFRAGGQKMRRGPKPKPRKESTVEVKTASCTEMQVYTEQPKEPRDNLNAKIPECAKEEGKPEKVNLRDVTGIMKTVLCKKGIYPGIDLKKIETSYEKVVVELRDQILAGLKTENPVLDLAAIFVAATSCPVVSRELRIGNLKKLRSASFWLSYVRAGFTETARASLQKDADAGTLKFRRYGS